jgi:hypothetical protein
VDLFVCITGQKTHRKAAAEKRCKDFNKELNKEYRLIKGYVINKDYKKAQKKIEVSKNERSFIYLWYLIMDGDIKNNEMKSAGIVADRILFLSDNLYEANFDYFKIDDKQMELISIIAESYLVKKNLNGFKRMVVQLFSNSTLSPSYIDNNNLKDIFTRWNKRLVLLEKNKFDETMVEKYELIIKNSEELTYFKMKEKFLKLIIKDKSLLNFIEFIRVNYDE